MIRNNPIRHFITVIAFFGLLLLPVNSVQAHSGRTDSTGCHNVLNNSGAPIDRHCHSGGSDSDSRGSGGSSSGGGSSNNSSDNALCIIGGIVVGGIILGVILYSINSMDGKNDLIDVDGGEILPVYDIENERVGIRYRTDF